VVLFHGFVIGALVRLPMRFLASELSRTGIAVFSNDYRLRHLK